MRRSIALYTITSDLHDAQSVDASTREFLGSLKIDYEFKGADFSDYGSHSLDLIFVRTGGTEGIFKRLYTILLTKSSRPFYLLTSGKSNSLAASMEILSFLRQNNLRGEIIHGEPSYISERIAQIESVEFAKSQLHGCRLGVIGKPSDWLISSQAVKNIIKNRLGVELLDIPMQELIDELSVTPLNDIEEAACSEQIGKALPGAYQIYDALKVIVKRHNLQGFTLRCFDLLTSVHNTGCMALSKFNSEGIVAGCEGDVPAMVSMKIVQSLTGGSGFQANPARINTETGEMLFAHCTIPFNMVERYELDTHFESGIGVGIRGFMKEGPVTIFKLAGDMSRYFIEEGMLIRNQAQPDLCRTQQIIRLSNASSVSYFLTNPIGNHHIVVPGHWKKLIKELLNDSE